jgi:hypothetical protein
LSRIVPVYAAERRDGLAEQIQSNASIAYLAPIRAFTPDESTRRLAAQASAAPIDDANLICFDDILATTGWNLNRDVFTHEELWAARHTIDHKPINLEHQYLQIVGHVLSSRAVDADFSPIDEATPVDELPAKFHVRNSSVLYRQIGDEERDEYMANLEKEILAGEYFVSMEAFFSGFDYGVTAEDGSRAIIPRTTTTAFLTKHLWQYGGSGSYLNPVDGKAYALGRVMKNVRFKGKGIVRRPGNPDSIIFAQVEAFQANCDLSLVYQQDEGSAARADEPTEEPTMPEPAADLQAELAAAQKRIADLEADKTSQATKEFETQIADLSEAKAELEKRVADLTTANAAHADRIKALDDEVATLKSDLDAKATALAAIEAEKTKADRVARVLAEGADASLAAGLVEQFAALDADKFDAAVKLIAPSWKTGKSKVEAEKEAIANAKVETPETLAVETRDEAEAARADLIHFYTQD